MGFYGVLPDAQINVRDFSLPLARLSFVMVAQGTSDGRKHRSKFQVLGPDGEVILPGSESTADHPPSEGTVMKLHLSITTMNPRLPHPGRYQVVFEVDDQEHYKSSFIVAQDPQAK